MGGRVGISDTYGEASKERKGAQLIYEQLKDDMGSKIWLIIG